jgi:hypothetical protein
VPEHPSFQEYCRVCMTKIRGVEQQMRDSVETKDLEQLELAIEIGNTINVVRARCHRCVWANAFCVRYASPRSLPLTHPPSRARRTKLRLRRLKRTGTV